MSCVKSLFLSFVICLCFAAVCRAEENVLLYALDGDDYFSREETEHYISGIEGMMEKLDSEIQEIRHLFPQDELLPYEKVENCILNVRNKTTYGDGSDYGYAWYEVEPGQMYFVTGGSATSVNSYPLGAFYDAEDNLLRTFGTKKSTVYEDEPMLAPDLAAKMVVNRNNGADLIVKKSVFRENETNREYNLRLADEMIRVRKLNPFLLSPLEQGYVTFVFDDLTKDLDAIAAVFEEYGFPIVIAAIPSRLDESADGLEAERGSYRPGMLMRDIMKTAVELGGEIMAHNDDLVVTEENQYDHFMMFDYFIKAREDLEEAGFSPRGIIRSGGKGSINYSDETERWLIGNYEYSNMGIARNFALERKSINRLPAEVKSDIKEAYETNGWLRLMCHGYKFGQGETFRNETDLREILDYCRYLGIPVVTYAYMIDTYGSTELEEWMKIS